MAKKKPSRQPSNKPTAPRTASATLAPIRSALPVLAASRRAALRSLFTDAQCEAWGAKTKSMDVHADGSRFALVIVKTLSKRPDDVDGYSLARAAYLVECLDALATAIAEQKGGEHAAANADTLRAAAEKTAAKVARKLRRKLRAIAGGNPERLRAIALRGAVKDHDAKATCEGLAGLAEEWLGDKSLAELAQEARLGAADVAAGKGAAQALGAAREGKTLGGRDGQRDTPPVNRAEGRVLREMRWAMDCFGDAHEDDSTIPLLVPSAATRAVLATKHAAEEETVVAPPPPQQQQQPDGVQRAPKP